MKKGGGGSEDVFEAEESLALRERRGEGLLELRAAPAHLDAPEPRQLLHQTSAAPSAQLTLLST